MSKSNKELAVDLYRCYLETLACVHHIPEEQKTLKTPTLETIVTDVEWLTKRLAQIEG